MSPTSLLLFAVALLLGSASPGPAVVSLLARGIGRGRTGLAGFIAGLIVGDLFWLTVAVLGLAVLAGLLGTLFLVLKIAGAAYLAYLGVRMWRSSGALGHAEFAATQGRGAFLGGLLLTLGNPKVMAFYLALLPSLIDLGALTALGYAELVAVMVPILIAVLGTYAVLSLRARRLVTGPRTIRLVNRLAGTAMFGAAVAVATR